MDLEAPADGWYVFVAVAIFSMVAAALALSLPAAPPPDANGAANAIDRVGSQPYGGATTYEHDAEQYWVANHTIAFKGDGGTASANVRFGSLAPAWPDDDLKLVLHGESPKDVFASQSAFETAVEDAIGETREPNGDRVFVAASGTLQARKVTWGEYSVVLVLA
jgi:hypothetical protein